MYTGPASVVRDLNGQAMNLTQKSVKTSRIKQYKHCQVPEASVSRNNPAKAECKNQLLR